MALFKVCIFHIWYLVSGAFSGGEGGDFFFCVVILCILFVVCVILFCFVFAEKLL